MHARLSTTLCKLNGQFIFIPLKWPAHADIQFLCMQTQDGSQFQEGNSMSDMSVG